MYQRIVLMIFLFGMEFIKAQNDTLIISNGIISRTYLISQIDSITFSIPPVSAGNEKTGDSAPVFIIRNSYPNPFNPETKLTCLLPSAGNIGVEIFDLNGALIRNIFSGEVSSGQHTFIWDGRNASGIKAASGVYIFKINFDNKTYSHKILLIK